MKSELTAEEMLILSCGRMMRGMTMDKEAGGRIVSVIPPLSRFLMT
jgi:hypothetical protein